MNKKSINTKIINTVLLLSLAISGILSCSVIIPAYKSPLSRTQNSKYAYSNMQRSLGFVQNVDLSKVVTGSFNSNLLGEGMLHSQSVLIPIIPMARVEKLHVEEGDYVKKGQLLLELENTLASAELESAKLALRNAKSEQQRVNIGSNYILAQERPEKDKINLLSAEKNIELLSKRNKRFKSLLHSGAVSKDEYLESELKLTQAKKEYEQAKFSLSMSSKGQEQSIDIARNVVSDQKHQLKMVSNELKDYKIYATDDGIVEKVLIRQGEYNQDSGRPAFILATGLWFEAHLDQMAISSVKKGNLASVHLEAYPGVKFSGEITRVYPIVTYNQGGPESERPLRPRGSSSPEWPSTFKVRIELNQKNYQLVPGLTGFAKINSNKKSKSIPLKAITSVTNNKALVYLPVRDSFEVREVVTGVKNSDSIEILSGLELGDLVIMNGFYGLEKGDKVNIVDSV